MRHRPNLLTPLLAAAGCLLTTSPVLAQQVRPGEVMGMRYLSWSGKAETPADGLRRSSSPTPASMPASAPSAAGNTRYPGIQTASRPSRYGAGSTGLTPASVWIGAPHSAALSAQPVVQQPDPAAQAQAQAAYQMQVQSQYQAWYQSEAQAQYEAQVRATPQPAQQVVRVPAADPRQQAMQAQQALAQQAQAPQQAEPQYQQRADATPQPGYDPMAPRRDAPIFRMQQPQGAQAAPAPQSEQPAQQTAVAQGEIQSPVLTQPTAGRTYSGQAYAGAEPPRESARYYSVHRAEGRQPDPIAMPVSVYLDNAPIDLAEPPAAPVPTRTVNGRTQLIVANQDPTLP